MDPTTARSNAPLGRGSRSVRPRRLTAPSRPRSSASKRHHRNGISASRGGSLSCPCQPASRRPPSSACCSSAAPSICSRRAPDPASASPGRRPRPSDPKHVCLAFGALPPCPAPTSDLGDRQAMSGRGRSRVSSARTNASSSPSTGGTGCTRGIQTAAGCEVLDAASTSKPLPHRRDPTSSLDSRCGRRT